MLVPHLSAFILHFVIYSFVGWICETIFCSIQQRRFVNRGFLSAPLCPIYGFGAFLILLVGRPLAAWPPLVFLGSVIATSLLEYFTGWLLETLFQIRWWDYSHHRFNLKGRVCLTNALLFGLMGLFAVYAGYPLVQTLLEQIPWNVQRVLASLVSIVIFMDAVSTVNSLVNLSERLRRLQSVFQEMDRYDKERGWFDWGDLSGSVERLRAICAEDADNEIASTILKRLDSLSDLQGAGTRLAASFPRMQSPRGLTDAMAHMRGLLDQRWEQIKQRRGETVLRRMWYAVKTAAAAFRDAARASVDTFVSRRGLYKLFWVFVIASVLGYAAEMLWCLVSTGQLESRQGLIYGPLSPVYGLGAVLMVVLLNRLAEQQSPVPVFIGGMVVGGAYEFLVSLVQELVFGTVSWDYSEHALGVMGRTNLAYMVFWGLLCTGFLRAVYPRIASVVERMERRPRRFFTAVFGVFLAFNILISSAAVYRWEARVRGVPAENAIETFLDTHYADDIMEQVYPNMQFVE